jgi:hypothetical protein
MVQPASVHSTGLNEFTLTNNSPYAVDVSISVGNMTGGTTWQPSDTATPGINVFGLLASSGTTPGIFYVGFAGTKLTIVGTSTSDYGYCEVGFSSTKLDPYDIIVRYTEPYELLIENLEASGSYQFGMKIFIPTVFSDGAKKTGTVTLWVEAH